ALLLWCGRPLEAAGDSTLRYPAATDATLYTVCWTGSQFVAAGQGGVIFTSPDGSAWTSRPSTLAGTRGTSAAGGGKIVLAGDSSAVVTSPDGIVWTVQPISSLVYGARIQAAAWNGSVFMLDGRYSSPDGNTWTEVADAVERTSPFTGLST